jgi:hypothetical protein
MWTVISTPDVANVCNDRARGTEQDLTRYPRDAFNKCSSPEQLQKHAAFFAPDVEFYHDMGGVTWTRDAMIAKTRKNVCGNFRRELVPGTLRVFPIKDFGAIEQGSHRFCQFATGKCDGLAEFVIVWRKQKAKWQITRVLSYAHRPAR